MTQTLEAASLESPLQHRPQIVEAACLQLHNLQAAPLMGALFFAIFAIAV